MEIQGHKELQATLERMVDSGRVPHALLLHEDDGGGAFPLLLTFLDRLYDHNPRVRKLIHPDIYYVFPVAGLDKPVSEQFMGEFRALLSEQPFFYEQELYAAIGIEGKQTGISVHEARGLLQKLSLSALEGSYRTVVVYLPEKMNEFAANALLKMVEEPPAQTLFLLVTHAPEKVLQTIRSRCLLLRVPPLTRAEMHAVHQREGAEADALADLFHDLMSALLRRDLPALLEAGEAAAALDSREKMKTFCREAGQTLRQVFLLQQGLNELVLMTDDERPFFQEMACGLRKNFSRLALPAFDRAQLLIERNVHPKILFTELVNRLYMLV